MDAASFFFAYVDEQKPTSKQIFSISSPTLKFPLDYNDMNRVYWDHLWHLF